MRIKWIIPEPPKDWGYHNPNNKSYLFRVKMRCYTIPPGLHNSGKPIPSGYMNYGGKRTLQSANEEIGTYIGSLGKDCKTELSKEIEKVFRELYATSEEVIVEILEYGNLADIGYGESKMLREVGNGVGAASMNNWFNQTNGGGTGTQGFTWMSEVERVLDKVKRTEDAILEIRKKYPDECTKGSIEDRKNNTQKYLSEYEDVFSINFSWSGEIKIMLEEKNRLQVRAKVLAEDSWRTFKGRFDNDPNPDKFGFSIQLEPKNLPALRKIGSGNNRGKGCYESDKGIGMWDIRIPYEVYKDWPFHIIKLFFGEFNPQFGDDFRTPMSVEDDAQTIIDYLNGENIKVDSIDDDGNKILIPNIHHQWVKDFYKRREWPPHKQLKIQEECERLIDDDTLQLKDDNIVVYSPTSFQEDALLKKGYDQKCKELSKSEKNPNGYDWILLSSCSANDESKIIDKIVTAGFDTSKKALV